MCSCAGGYNGNDCSTRLCPKGDDPLTYEVENSGDGAANQGPEVQTVTFTAGRGIGGTATLTYNDLYGQSWTTRPFNVGGDNVYRLEVSIKEGVACGTNSCDIRLSYNNRNADISAHGDVQAPPNAAGYAVSTGILTAAEIREALLVIFGPYLANPIVKKDRANTIYVRKHQSATSIKLGGNIESAVRMTFDIYLPIDMTSHDDNGSFLSGLTASWKGTATVNSQEVKIYQLGDRSAEIANALTSLPNQVIPSVTVSKASVTDTGTNSDGANGNVYSQSYDITFDNAANAGDQNMLSCNAAPCDEDGCTNRGPGVSEVRYMHHDAENHGEGINFVNQGYFIMDIGSDAVETALSAGSIKIMWPTGAGIDSAIFAIVATAAEVQAALRTITGWEGVTVELWGSKAQATDGVAAKLLVNHQFKVTFAAGYDDSGKSPTFYTMLNTDGAYATAEPTTARARLYDQRFSNSIWLGKTTGFIECTGATNAYTCDALKHTAIDGSQTVITPNAEDGDIWATSQIMFGVGGTTGAAGVDPGTVAATISRKTLKHNNPMTTTINDYGSSGTNGDLGVDGLSFVYLYEGATSVQTSDYFAVGSTIEVLGTTWTQADLDGDVDIGVGATNSLKSNNKYRKFKVLGHFTNQFNREFAKLDSFPADDGVYHAAVNTAKPDYNLKITSNNGTVHQYTNLAATVTVNEVQAIIFGTGADSQAGVFKLEYKGELTEDMDQASTIAQIAEEINGFSALSGPVTVALENDNKLVTFDAKDGDVAQMIPHIVSGGVSIATRRNGWSIEGPSSMGLESMQAGGIINITAPERCNFKTGAVDGSYFFCYNGVCGSEFAGTADSGAGDNADFQAAIEDVKDNNGDTVIASVDLNGDGKTGYCNDDSGTKTKAQCAGDTCTVATVADQTCVWTSDAGEEMAVSLTSTTDVHVDLPIGYSCDGLEMRIAAAGGTSAITKTVNKHNNGKQFRITRSFLQETAVAGDILNAGASATAVTCGVGAQTATTGCQAVVANIDAVLIAQQSSCGALVGATDGSGYPIHRTITAVNSATVPGGHALTVAATGQTSVGDDNCDSRIARYVLTLDSMPTASAHTTLKNLNYVSPVGSCSVSETTKGTYESYECSNRGACDGKSGLCTCYEGYSGQSCQTQTVLV
jgi:hypothetical protein